MAEAKSRKGKGPARKAAPRTTGTPKAPPKPRKVAAPAKPKASAARAPKTRTPTAPAAPPRAVPRPPPVAPAPAPEPQWIPAPDPAPAPAWAAVRAPASPARDFDPATGNWILVPAGEAPAEDPAAYKRGATRSILSNVLLGIGLGLLALNFLFALVVGGILILAPDSDTATDLRDDLAVDSPGDIIANALLTFVLVGVIPFVWVLGTRVRPWLGTVRFLQLRAGARDVLRGVGLVVPMILSVYVLVAGYVCVTEGCDALTEPADPEDDMGGLLSNLNWAVVIVVPLCAGIGEEILFRGVLQRWLGVWGQGLAFGLAHASNGFLPQIVFAFALGVVFGHLYKRGWSLVTLIIAHTLYDFVLLAMALLYPDLG